MRVRVGIAHHLGWAVAVTADDDHRVVDRRRIELLEPGLPSAPVHHEGGPHAMHRTGPPLTDGELRDLMATVRAAAMRAATAALDELPSAITSISVAAWADDPPDDIALLRLPPWESRVDSIMYRQVLADCARARDWEIHHFDAKTVERDAAVLLGDRADDVLLGPRDARPAVDEGPPHGAGGDGRRRPVNRARNRA